MGSDDKTGLNDESGVVCNEPLVWFFFVFFLKNSNDAFYFLSMF